MARTATAIKNISNFSNMDASVPLDLGIHLVVDNYATHKQSGVKRWLATHPRFQVRYTPTSAPWLNQAEICFNNISKGSIRPGNSRA